MSRRGRSFSSGTRRLPQVRRSRSRWPRPRRSARRAGSSTNLLGLPATGVIGLDKFEQAHDDFILGRDRSHDPLVPLAREAFPDVR